MPAWQRKLLYAIIILNIGFLAFQVAVYVQSHQKSTLFSMLYAVLLILYCVLRLRNSKNARYYITVDEQGLVWQFPFFAKPEQQYWPRLKAISFQGAQVTLQPQEGETIVIDLQPGFEASVIQAIQAEISKQAKAQRILIQ